MYTLGYRFRPWTGERSIADGPSILAYVRETAAAYGVAEKVRYDAKVLGASWSSDDATWTVRLASGDDHDLRLPVVLQRLLRLRRRLLARVRGHRGVRRAVVVHPQQWPEDLAYDGKRVVVIGSGATAVTLVPALAERAAHVTMLQRSPTYVLSLPGIDRVAVKLRERLSPARAYAVTRWKNVLVTTASYQLSRRRPELMKKLIRKGVARRLPEGYDVDRHFKPAYDPWDQRLCLVPDGDLFRVDPAAATSTSSPTTSTPSPRPASGSLRARSSRPTSSSRRPACPCWRSAGSRSTSTGSTCHLPDTMAYKGMLLSGVPNFAYVVGYTNASWTLKADLVSEYVCRLLEHMQQARARRRGGRARGRRRGGAVHGLRLGLRAEIPAPASEAGRRVRPGGCARTTSATCSRSVAGRSRTTSCGSPGSPPVASARPREPAPITRPGTMSGWTRSHGPPSRRTSR